MKQVLILLAVLTVFISGVARADAPVQLDAGLRADLAALPTLNGKTFDADDVRPTLVTFFASWCPPCREEFRYLNKLRAAIPEDRLEIIAINILEDWGGLSNPKKLKRFLRQTAPEFTTVEGNDAIAKAFEGVNRLPTVFVFDTSGVKTTHFIHAPGAKKMSMTYDELKAAVTAVMGDAS